MQLFVSMSTGKAIALDTEASDTVKSLKAKIRNEEGLSCHQQRWIFAGEQMEDGHTPSDYGIQSMARLQVVSRLKRRDRVSMITPIGKTITLDENVARPLPEFRSSTQIFVKQINGKSIAIIVDPRDTILDVKNMLWSRLLIPTFQQGLLFCGRQLKEAHTVSYYGIRKSSTLHMVALLRGGMRVTEGIYKVVHEDLPVSEMQARSSAVLALLSAGTFVEVVEVAKVLDEGRVRARIKNPAGWISTRMGDGSCEFVVKANAAIFTESINELRRQTLRAGAAEAEVNEVLEQADARQALFALINSKQATPEPTDPQRLQPEVPYNGKAQQKDDFPEVIMKMPKNDTIVAKDPNGDVLTVLEVDGAGPNSQGRVRWKETEGWVKMCNVVLAEHQPSTGRSSQPAVYPQRPQQEVSYKGTAQQKDDFREVVMKMPKNDKIVAKVPNGEMLTVLEVDGAGPNSQGRVRWKETEGWVKMCNVVLANLADKTCLEAKTALTDKDKAYIQNMLILRMSAESIVDWFHDDGYESSVVRAYLDELAAGAKAKTALTDKDKADIQNLFSKRMSAESIVDWFQDDGYGSSVVLAYLDELAVAAKAQRPWICTWKHGVRIRCEPDLVMARSSGGDILQCGETFHVSEEKKDEASGVTITFLKMADGRGWVFDRDLQDTVCELVEVRLPGGFGTEHCGHATAQEHADGDIHHFGRKLVVPWSVDEAFRRRQQVLHETLRKLSTRTSREEFHTFARTNVSLWQLKAASKPMEDKLVCILCGDDWGKLTGQLTKRFGKIFAVLNMANAYVAGGGYLEGCPAQEENMFRRSDCHFSVTDKDFDQTEDRYWQHKTDLLNAVEGRVYLNVKFPRVCIRGPETDNGHGYQWLDKDEVFPFYEMRAAAVDHRPTANHQEIFSEPELQRRINAQFDTLVENDIRYVVLSAFGCGAFLNPASAVAKCYRVAVENRATQFDCIAFAVYYPGYGPDNLTPFKEAFASSPWGAVGGQLASNTNNNRAAFHDAA